MSVTLCAMIQSPEKEAVRAEKLPVRMTSIFRCLSGPLVNMCIALTVHQMHCLFNSIGHCSA